MAVADVDIDHPAIPIDPDGMHQVIMNLLSNALDAVEPRKGLIRVVCHLRRREQVERDRGDRQRQRHLAGDDAAHVRALSLDKGNRGTGLGLAVTKKIVDEHEGSLTVKSAPGEGTTFTIRLPVYHETLSDPSHTHGPAR
jgi:two-component system OmpR family sensor kinase